MTRFERGDVVLDDTAEAHDLNRVRAQSRLMVIAEGDEKEQTREECDDDNADGGSGQEFEMKMLRAEKPGAASSEKPSAYLCLRVGGGGLSHYKFQKAVILPGLWSVRGRPSVAGRKEKSVANMDEKYPVRRRRCSSPRNYFSRRPQTRVD